MTTAGFKARLRAEREAVRDFVQGAATGDVETFSGTFGRLDSGCWARAFRALARLGCVHEKTKRAFLDAWLRSGDHIRNEVLNEVDHDLPLIAALRLLLPAYVGPSLTLYRGDGWANRKHRTYGVSWTDDCDSARSFAMGAWRKSDGGSVLLEAVVPAEGIICAPALIDDRYAEREFIVDRRRLKSVRVLERFSAETLYS